MHWQSTPDNANREKDGVSPHVQCANWEKQWTMKLEKQCRSSETLNFITRVF